jgi:hypothetical protein
LAPISTQPPLLLFGCRCIGSVHKKIDSSEGLSGTVLNVFDRAVNIKTSGDELLVVSLGRVASPLTINVVPPSNSAARFTSFIDLIRNGDHVFVARKSSADDVGIADTHIMVGSRCAILMNRPVRFFENHILKPDLENLLKFSGYREHLMSVLKECATDRAGSLLNPDITTEGLLPEFMNLIRDHAIDFKSSGFEDILSRSLDRFCGRGPGFTPGGDDFISGVLAILNWIHLELNLGSPIIPGSDYRKLTTWTSFKLMECNAQGLVDIEVQDLINSVAEGDVLHYADSIRRIAKRGHTSGIDFVTGATIAIYLAIDGIMQIT